jgi:hypothetical protein
MEEFLSHGYQYMFILPNKTFTAIFDRIDAPNKTLFVTDYTDENGKVPGTRSMPFSWVKQVELVSIPSPSQSDIEVIDISMKLTLTKKKKKKNKTPEYVNNFTL